MTDQTSSPAQQAQKSALPVFYRQPELLTSEKHARKSLASSPDHRFARETNSVPLNGVELELAQRHYPIVFSEEATPFPMAILGLRTSENLFVEPSGRWTDGIYVPAYVRRYPFVFMSAPDQKQFALCIDAASGFVIDGDSNPFFRDGQPTDLTKNALGFCASFQAEYEKTRAFAAALTEHKLLESRNATIELANGQKFVFGPFRAVDAAKLAALPNAVIADWLRSGWLGWIYAHLMSAPNWTALAARMKAPA